MPAGQVRWCDGPARDIRSLVSQSSEENGRGFGVSDSGPLNILLCNFETGFGSLIECGSTYFLWETEYYPVSQSSILRCFFC